MRESTNNKNKKDTPDSLTEWKDVRENKGAMTYPDYEQIKTRSGHVILYDDSKDNESIIIQHRGGSKLMFLPDGAVQILARNGQQTVTYGENEVIITGRHDITVKGDASLKVTQNMNMTVEGDMKTAVTGNYDIIAKNINQVAAEQFTAKAQAVNMSASKNVSITAEGGSASIISKGAVGLISQTDVATVSGEVGVGMRTSSGWAAIQGATVSVRAKGGIVGIDGASDVLINQDASLSEVKDTIKKKRNPEFASVDSSGGARI